MVHSDTAKVAISQGLGYAQKLYDMGTLKIENKKVKKLSQSELAKKPLKQRTRQSLFKAVMDPKGFGVSNTESKYFFNNN